jgi:hypothetical protein
MNEKEREGLGLEEEQGEPTPEPEAEAESEVESEVDTTDTTDTVAEETLEPAATPVVDDEPTSEEVEESPTTSVDEEPTSKEVGPEPEKMLTQSQVNEIVGRARQEGRESALRELYERYGVSGDEELNSVFGLGQVYHDLDDEFKAQGNSYKEALAENALLKSRADESRWEDIKLILGGKGLDITMENIESLIPSHPEWRTTTAAQQQQPENAIAPEVIDEEMARDIRNGAYQPQAAPEKTAKVRRLGGEATPATEIDSVGESEEEKLRRLFNI